MGPCLTSGVASARVATAVPAMPQKDVGNADGCTSVACRFSCHGPFSEATRLCWRMPELSLVTSLHAQRKQGKTNEVSDECPKCPANSSHESGKKWFW